MEQPVPHPHTINALRWGADATFAMLAGMHLDVFTLLHGGPRTPEQLATALGVRPARLRLLLYALVAAGLLTEQDGRFANTPEAQHFLVQGTPTSLSALHRNLAAQWAFKLHTATSLRSGVPQAHLDFAQASPEVLEAFLRRINVSTVAAAQELGARYDFMTWVCFFRNDTANSSFPVLSNVLFGQPVFPPETSFKGARAEGFSANLAW